LIDFEVFLVLRSVEAFKDNGHEQIEENEGNDHHKTYEVEVGDGRISTFQVGEVIFFEAFIILGFHAFEDNRTLSCTIVHQLMPRFSCGHSEQSYDSIMEVLKVSMNADWVLHLYSSEDLNAQNRVNEQDQEEKTSNIGELLDSSDESL